MQTSYSVQAIGVKGYTSQSQDLRLGIVVASQMVRWTDIFGIFLALLKASPSSSKHCRTILNTAVHV